ncbi:dihydropteroate synthase [Rhodoferax mekongensis]|uniref:Dihydropteroate synthase n=1 Tax=Rhodoferax mekongensis TaxID=3068341 RepID=A0ABZ0AVF0_9BURK|nr:dihydropteroate synthase [Rhodoferax sp. TBRC 17307]WNO03260.1 dihydropteroate synthase [Rhodoferax sp. TBRC 17307]
MHWQTTRYSLDLSRPHVMGIVNVTPDSFSDGGLHATSHTAIAHCEELLKDGADILDIGGESTRPGAPPVSQEEELARVLPVIRHAVTLGVPISVDTYKPAVMQAALDLGADIINDVWALRWAGDAQGKTGQDVIAAHPHCGVCLMHMHRDPQTMQAAPMEGDVVPQVLSFLERSAKDLRALGVDKSRICLDPGIGFGKTVKQNFSLLARQEQAIPQGYAVLAGWSRKSSLAAIAHTSLAQAAGMNIELRRAPSVTAAVLAVQNGAHVVRVHDVRDTVSALRVLAAMQAEKMPPLSKAALANT